AGIWDDDPHLFEFCTRGSRRPRFTRDKGPVVYGLCLQRRNHICRRATTACKPFLVDALRIIASEDLGVLRLGVMRRELPRLLRTQNSVGHAAHTLHNYLLGRSFGGMKLKNGPALGMLKKRSGSLWGSRAPTMPCSPSAPRSAGRSSIRRASASLPTPFNGPFPVAVFVPKASCTCGAGSTAARMGARGESSA